MTGVLYGVGLGPGDPELVTLKAARILAVTGVVAYFAKKGRRGHARTIADALIAPQTDEIAMHYPLTTEIPFGDSAYITALSAFYETSAERIAQKLRNGENVALLCEGDPMFYGSFMHLYERLRKNFPVEICAGVSGMSGCFAVAGQCMTWGDDILTVLPGTLPEDQLTERLAATDAAVIMKLGSNLPKIRRALKASDLFAQAIYVERGTMAGQRVMPLADLGEQPAPYFAIILVPGSGRRP